MIGVSESAGRLVPPLPKVRMDKGLDSACSRERCDVVGDSAGQLPEPLPCASFARSSALRDSMRRKPKTSGKSVRRCNVNRVTSLPAQLARLTVRDTARILPGPRGALLLPEKKFMARRSNRCPSFSALCDAISLQLIRSCYGESDDEDRG